MQFVDFKTEKNELKKNYNDAFNRVLNSGWYILGKEVESFEIEFAKYLGVSHVVGVANGLEAIQISLMALGIGEGDEVITTPLSAVATTLAILAVRATPVFIDIKKDGQIDEKLIEDKITNKTKAILPVHLYGHSCNMEKIRQIAIKNKLYLVEDAAQAHGSTYKNKMLGTIGDFGCFSFYPTKNLGALGDGGAIATNNEEFAKKCRQIRDYGQAKKYEHVIYGLNSRLDEIQAAFLREKLKFIKKMNIKRQSNATIYHKYLTSNKIELVSPSQDSLSNYHQFTILTKDRKNLQNYLKEKSIPTLIHYPITIPNQPMFNKKYKSLNLPIANQFADEVLSLPCGPYLKSKDIKLISNTINDYFHTS